MNKPEDVGKWLAQDPDESEIQIHVDGGRYLPYPLIVEKLYALCGNEWGTQNFIHSAQYTPEKRLLISGSIEIKLKYEEATYMVPTRKEIRMIERILSGAATFYADEYFPNEHFAATCKSLAIVNAVQVLGPQFGWGLNKLLEKLDSPPTSIPSRFEEKVRKAVKLPADAEMRKKYAIAVAAKNFDEIHRLETIYRFETDNYAKD